MLGTPVGSEAMDATLLLCDHAEAVGGKLYINGGGWNVLLRPGVPVNVSLAILIEVPWDEAGTEHHLRTYLLTEDGVPIGGPQGDGLQVDGSFEVGRPPGVKPGSTLNTPLAIKLNALVLDAGGYEWRLEVDGALVARKPFRVASSG
jgi:hypothetical protein